MTWAMSKTSSQDGAIKMTHKKRNEPTPPTKFNAAQKADFFKVMEFAYDTLQVSPSGVQMPSPINGSDEPKNEWEEIGATGLRAYMGFIHEAYNAQLTWPAVFPLYNRLRRSDPEITMIRQAFTAMSRQNTLEWELPDDPTDEEKAAQEFGYEVLDDMEGGPTQLLEMINAHVPFMGFGYWEVVPGIRSEDWTPPTTTDPTTPANMQDEDAWRSQYDDGRIGIRRLGWRDHSSFWRWDFGTNMQLKGMIQRIPPGYPPPLYRSNPLNRALHLKFGDTINPEGLTPQEAVWRLERLKYGYEVVQGIGFEHSAGFLKFKKTEAGAISTADKNSAKTAARNIMTAQEGNYAYIPFGVEAELMDTPFQAAPAILEVIKYLGITKMQVYNMGWMSIGTTSSHGSLAAVEDASSMAMLTYNAMMDGFADQMDAQLGRRIFQWNSGAFPGLTLRTAIRSKSFRGGPTKQQGGPISQGIRRPRLTISKIDKVLDLAKLGALLTAIDPILPLGPEDAMAIRKLTGFLPETLPDPEEVINNKPAPVFAIPGQQGPESKMQPNVGKRGGSTPGKDGEEEKPTNLAWRVMQNIKELTARKQDNNRTAGPRKTDLAIIKESKWKTYGPFELWKVNGPVIRGTQDRRPVFQDFTEGGNPARYPWLEDKRYPEVVMIAIDSGLDRAEWKPTAVHEIVEFCAMTIDGLNYADAHTNKANPAEAKVRKDPEAFDSIIEKEVERYNKFLEEEK
jgi:hypothetical protein